MDDSGEHLVFLSFYFLFWDFWYLIVFVLPLQICYESIYCLSHQCTTAGKRQERGEQSPVGLRGLWGRVLSNCQGLFPSATDSGSYSQLYTAGRGPERQRHERSCRAAIKSAEGKITMTTYSPESGKQTRKRQWREDLAKCGLLSSGEWCIRR